MKNAVGRDIPDFLLQNGMEVYQGKNYMDGKYLQKASPAPVGMRSPRKASWWIPSRTPCGSWAQRAA